jgi:hypothetical protein
MIGEIELERRVNSNVITSCLDGEISPILASLLRFLCSKGFRLFPCESRLSKQLPCDKRTRISFKIFITAEGTKSTINNYDRARPLA